MLGRLLKRKARPLKPTPVLQQKVDKDIAVNQCDLQSSPRIIAII